MAMRVRADRLPFETGIDTSQIFSTSQLLSQIIGFGVQPNKAIVGRNAFAHEAGIHQHGVISNPLCYEIMTPESVGVLSNELVLGKHSGRHALALRYHELGYALDAVELDSAYRRFTELADRKKRIYDQDLISLVVADVALSSEAGLAIGESELARKLPNRPCVFCARSQTFTATTFISKNIRPVAPLLSSPARRCRSRLWPPAWLPMLFCWARSARPISIS